MDFSLEVTYAGIEQLLELAALGRADLLPKRGNLYPLRMASLGGIYSLIVLAVNFLPPSVDLGQQLHSLFG